MTTIAYTTAKQQQMPAATDLLYTCPLAATSAHVAYSNATSITTGVVTLTVNKTPLAGVSMYLLNGKPLAAKGTDNLFELANQTLGPGDTVYAHCSAASSVDLEITFKEIYE